MVMQIEFPEYGEPAAKVCDCAHDCGCGMRAELQSSLDVVACVTSTTRMLAIRVSGILSQEIRRHIVCRSHAELSQVRHSLSNQSQAQI